MPENILQATRYHHDYAPDTESLDLLDDIIRVADHQSYRLLARHRAHMAPPETSAVKLGHDFNQGLSDQQNQEVINMMSALN